jgi:hypothetical protein
VLVAHPECIAGEGHAAGALEVHVGHDVGKDVARNGDVAPLGLSVAPPVAAAQDANVG